MRACQPHFREIGTGFLSRDNASSQMKRPGPMGSNRSGRGTPPIGIQPPVNAFQAAVRFHQQGRLQEAEQFYKAQLRVTPNHFEFSAFPRSG